MQTKLESKEIEDLEDRVQISVRIPIRLVKKTQEVCRKEFISRSSFVAQLIAGYFSEEDSEYVKRK